VRSNGSVSLLGQSVIIDKTAVGFAYAGYLIRLRCNEEKILSDFLNLTLETSELRTQIELPARSTTGVHNINSNEIKSLVIKLPPLEEQKEIVRRVEQLFKVADSIEAKYKKAMERVEKIEQSVLAKAFRGDLVEPDPNDEPAEELLKRILAEKAKFNRLKRGCKKC
jgi:type I restriction enzyme S subunit